MFTHPIVSLHVGILYGRIFSKIQYLGDDGEVIVLPSDGQGAEFWISESGHIDLFFFMFKYCGFVTSLNAISID